MLYLARCAAMCISIHTHTYGSASDFCSLAVFQPELPLPLKLSDSIPPLDIIRSHRYVMYTVVLYTTYIHPAYTPIAFPSLCVSVRTRRYVHTCFVYTTLLQLRCHSRLNFTQKLHFPGLHFHAFVLYILRFWLLS